MKKFSAGVAVGITICILAQIALAAYETIRFMDRMLGKEDKRG